MSETTIKIGNDTWIRFKGQALLPRQFDEFRRESPSLFRRVKLKPFGQKKLGTPLFPHEMSLFLFPKEYMVTKWTNLVVVRQEDIRIEIDAAFHRLGAEAMALLGRSAPTGADPNEMLSYTVEELQNIKKTACIGGIKWCCESGRNLGECHGVWNCGTSSVQH